MKMPTWLNKVRAVFTRPQAPPKPVEQPVIKFQAALTEQVNPVDPMPDIWKGLPPGTPFRRAQAKFRELYRISLLKGGEKVAALRELRPYKGRGKNFDYPFVKRIESRQESRSKYEPHQGAGERARRTTPLWLRAAA